MFSMSRCIEVNKNTEHGVADYFRLIIPPTDEISRQAFSLLVECCISNYSSTSFQVI